MSDGSVQPELPADSAQLACVNDKATSSSPSSISEQTVVPFKDRDFRSVARRASAPEKPSLPAGPISTPAHAENEPGVQAVPESHTTVQKKATETYSDNVLPVPTQPEPSAAAKVNSAGPTKSVASTTKLDSGTPWTTAGLSLQVDRTEKSLQPTAAARSKAVETVLTKEENGFVALALNKYVLKAVIDAGYEQPTPIQSEIIPHVLAGQDVLAQSQTGSGKTAAFALPILSLIDTGKNASRNPQVLVLTPTRELAIQVSKSFSTYGAYLPGFTVTTIYGGQSYDSQFRQLKRGVNVVVGTPGRVIDHIKRGTLNLSELGCLVLDEADEMLNMGFLDDVKFVLEHTPEERQVALFSATLPAPIRTIAEKHLDNPARVTIKQKTATADSIRQRVLFVTPRNKIDALKRVLEAEETDGVIIFTKTRDATVTVADQLKREGLSTVALNGDMPQRVRERTIEQLKVGELDILVATDVAARGLDVTRVSHVINYDAPNDNESYIHRVGRTGRMGRKGEAIIFLSKSQRGRLRQIERATKQTIEVIDLPTADDINATRVKRFMQKITEAAANEDVSVFEEMIQEFAEESEIPMLKIAAALAHLGQQGRPFFVNELRQAKRDRQGCRPDHDRESQFSRGSRQSAQGFPSSGSSEAGMDRYRVSVGREDGVKPGNIVGAVANEGGIDGDAIGHIRIHSTYSTIDLPKQIPAHVLNALQKVRVAGRPLGLRLYSEDTQASRRSAVRSGGKSRRRGTFGKKESGHPKDKSGKRPFSRRTKGSGKPSHKASKDNRRKKNGR